MSSLNGQQINATCGSVYINLNQEIISVNDGFSSILGYNIQGLQGTKLESLLTRSSRTLFQLYFLPLIKLNQKIDEMHLTFISEHGQVIPLDVCIEASESDGQTLYKFTLHP